jgi:hypothetical protein
MDGMLLVTRAAAGRQQSQVRPAFKSGVLSRTNFTATEMNALSDRCYSSYKFGHSCHKVFFSATFSCAKSFTRPTATCSAWKTIPAQQPVEKEKSVWKVYPPLFLAGPYPPCQPLCSPQDQVHQTVVHKK